MLFNTQTMRRTIFALWRMWALTLTLTLTLTVTLTLTRTRTRTRTRTLSRWAQGTLLHEWVRASEAKQACLHVAQTKWWLEQ